MTIKSHMTDLFSSATAQCAGLILTTALMATPLYAEPPENMKTIDVSIGDCEIAGNAEYTEAHIINVFDYSTSIDATELKTMLEGVAVAVSNTGFVNRIGEIAVSNLVFSSNGYVHQISPTVIISDQESADEAAATLMYYANNNLYLARGEGTNIGEGLEAAWSLAGACEESLNTYNDFYAHQIKINVITDGANTSGSPVDERDMIISQARATHVQPHTTISALGLVAEEDFPSFDENMRNTVIGGFGSFTYFTSTIDNFAAAYLEKIQMDLAEIFYPNGFEDRSFTLEASQG